MTDLERRALLGNWKAQEECTRQGIVLPCPYCGGAAKIIRFRDYGWKQFKVLCVRCFMSFDKNFYDEKKAIEQWNTRSALPIGRCASCIHWDDRTCECEAASDIEVAYHKYTEPDFFCGDYEPKDGEEDAEG